MSLRSFSENSPALGHLGDAEPNQAEIESFSVYDALASYRPADNRTGGEGSQPNETPVEGRRPNRESDKREGLG